MSPSIAELTTTALGELCAGGAISIGGLIGLVSLRASPARRGQLFHGKSGRRAPVSKMSLAALASFLLLFGGSLFIAGLTTGRAPKWSIPALTSLFFVLVVLGFVDAAFGDRDKDA